VSVSDNKGKKSGDGQRMVDEIEFNGSSWVGLRLTKIDGGTIQAVILPVGDLVYALASSIKIKGGQSPEGQLFRDI